MVCESASTRIWNLSSPFWTTYYAAFHVNLLSRDRKANDDSQKLFQQDRSVKSFEGSSTPPLSLWNRLHFLDASIIFHKRIILSPFVDDVDILSSKVCPSFVPYRLFILVRNWKFCGYLPRVYYLPLCACFARSR